MHTTPIGTQTIAAAGPRPIAHDTVLDVPLALTDYQRALDWMDAAIATGHHGYVCVAAVHTVMASQEDPELRAAVVHADMTLPDGQPLVWALNMLGHSLPDRVYGPTLMAKACDRAQRTGSSVYFYGGRDMEALIRAMRRR